MSWTEFTQHPNFPLWVLLAGLAVAVVAGISAWRKARFFQRSQVAQAEVVSFDKRSALEGNVWRAVVEFTDAREAIHQLEYIGSGPYPPFAKVKKLKVYYDPQNPGKAYAYSFWKVWSMELSLGFIALLMILIGVGNWSA
ncbi:MAG: DUF3592 domain-containing protein [Thiolinea sp.]